MRNTSPLPGMCLNKSYSTTRLLLKNECFDSATLSQPLGRVTEGGLRAKGYFKKSYTDKPLITVITVVLNGKRFLEHSIRSVLSQTYDNLEYLIIDGGSTDGTLDILRKNDHAIDFWVSQADKGIYDAMNKAVGLASGDWILFLGSDDSLATDYVLSEYIQSLSDRLHANPGFKPVMIFGDVIYSNGRRFRSALDFRILLHNTIHHQGSLYHRSLFASFRYDTNFRALADYELNLRVYLKKYPSLSVDKSLSFCRFGGVSSDIRHRKPLIREINTIRRKYVNFPIQILMSCILYLRTFGRAILSWM